MTLGPSTKTQYAAARGDNILSDGYDTPDQAKQQARHLAEQMTALGLEPDITVVEVLVKTTIGRAKPYREKTEETPFSDEAEGESGADEAREAE